MPTFTADAEAAEEEIVRAASRDDRNSDPWRDEDRVGYEEAAGWLSDYDGITADTTDEEIEALAAKFERDAHKRSNAVLIGAFEYLTERRDELVNKDDDDENDVVAERLTSARLAGLSR